MNRWIKRISLLVVACTLPGAVIVANYGSEALLVPARREIQDYHRFILDHPAEHGLEIVEFTTPQNATALIALPSPKAGRAKKSRALRDELTERGISLPPFGETHGTVVLLHGRNGRKEDFLPIAERFCAAGFACICWDLPGHGDSPVRFATFGHHECDHLTGLLQAARERHPLPEPTALFGYSQGGAIALQSAGLPAADYFAVISIASFAELGSLVHQGARDLHSSTASLAGPISALVRLGTRMRAGFDPARIRPDLAAARIQCPTYIVHGEDDPMISTAHAQRLFDSIPHSDKHLHLIPSASHNNVLAVGHNALYADLSAFLLHSLEKPGEP